MIKIEKDGEPFLQLLGANFGALTYSLNALLAPPGKHIYA